MHALFHLHSVEFFFTYPETTNVDKVVFLRGIS